MKCLIHNQMAWCKQDWPKWRFCLKFFSSKSAWIFACDFQFASKTFACIFLAEMLVLLCCIHCAHFNIWNKVQTSQKLQGNVLLLNWKAHLKKNEIHPIKSLTGRSVLSPNLQLLTSPLPCLFYILSARMAPSSSERENLKEPFL